MGAWRKGMRPRPSALLSVAVVLAATVGLSACSSAEKKSQESANSDKPVKIGVTLPLTGMFSIPGKNAEHGYQTCVDQLNKHGGMLGRKVQLIVRDNRSDTQTTVDQTQNLISSTNVNFLLGTFSTLLSFPSETIAEQNKMVYLEPSDSSLASHSRGYKYNFGFTLKPIDYIGESPVDAVKKFNEEGKIKTMPKTAAIVYEDNFFPDSIVRGLIGGKETIPGTKESVDFGKGYLADQGIKVVYKKQFPADYKDWTSLAAQVKASKADFLFVLTTATEINVVKALKTVAYKPQVAFFSEGTYPEFQQSLGKAVNGIMVWSTWSPDAQWVGELNGQSFSNQDFVAAYKAKYGAEPDEDMAQGFAVCEALANAVQDTKSLDNKKSRDWLAGRTADDPVKWIQGDYHFDDKGLTADRDVLLLQWQNEKLQFIYPEGGVIKDLKKPIWPMPNW
jgi:branched-chain amino acid transport system substrate-binding protein